MHTNTVQLNQKNTQKNHQREIWNLHYTQHEFLALRKQMTGQESRK